MIVFVIRCGSNQLHPFLLVGSIGGKQMAEFLIAHLLQHSITTDIEIVTGLDVSNMYDCRTHAVFLTRLDGTCDDILLRRRPHLIVRDFASLIQVINERVVATLVNDAVLFRTDMIDAAITNMSGSQASFVKIEKTERRAHLLQMTVVQTIQLTIGCLKGIEQVVISKRLLAQTKNSITHRLAHRLTRHFSMLVPSHAITKDEQMVIICRLAKCRENTVFLVVALPQLPNGLWLVYLYLHRLSFFIDDMGLSHDDFTSIP